MPLWTRVRPVLTLLALSLAAGGCGLLEPESERLGEELARARARWEAQGIESYRYVARQSCFCPPEILGPVTVEVVGGEVVRVVDLATDSVMLPSPYTGGTGFYSVDELFDLAAAVIASIDDQGAEVELDFHPELGYPARLAKFVPGTLDSGWTYTVTELTEAVVENGG